MAERWFRGCDKLDDEQGTNRGCNVAFGVNKSRLEELERQVRRNTERHEHEVRPNDLERVKSTLAEFSG